MIKFIAILLCATFTVNAGTITIYSSIYDPLKGTKATPFNVTKIEYKKAAPLQNVFYLTKTNDNVIHTTLSQNDYVKYYCVTAIMCRLDGKMTLYIKGRLFAAGFEK